MGGFELPITVRTAVASVPLLLDLPGPVRWATVAPLLCRAAGLPPGTPLFLGRAVPAADLLLGHPPLVAGSVLTTGTDADAGPDAGSLLLGCVAGPDAGRSVAVDGPVLVGRSPAAELTLADPELSARHAVLTPRRSGLSARDLGSTNGIRIDGRCCPPGGTVPVAVGTPLRLGASTVRLDLPAEPPLLRDPDGIGHWRLSLPPNTPTRFGFTLPPEPGPPPERTRRPLPLVASLTAALAGVLIAVVTGMWIFLMLAALGPVTMIASALGDRWSGRRTHRTALAEHRAAAQAYDRALAAGCRADRADAWERFADPARLLRWAGPAAVRLWEARPDSGSGGLEVVLSIGDREARLDTADPPSVGSVPLPLHLVGPADGPPRVIGVCGRRRGTVRWLLAQLAGRYPPNELGLQILSTAADLLPLADLPHTAGGGRAGRIHRTVGDLIAAADPTRTGQRCVVAVIDDVQRYRDDRALPTLARHRRSGLVVLALAATRHGLPTDCDDVIDLDTLPGEPIGVGPGYLGDLAAALAPLTVRRDGAAALPHPLRATAPSAAALAAAWQRPGPPVVDLGATATGPLLLDLAADGPHLLIAGTTGSGKSELLQTLIAGLAARLGPQRLSLLFVDYKGGAAFDKAARLPHCTGIVTDLDPRLAQRALRSLRAEIRRRERVAAGLGVPDLAAAAIDEVAGVPPRLVICVDEFATLAAELPEFLGGLVDIAQRGRSLGLHLVLATQRPAGVISPAIKANIATRICLRVTDAADSTDVIDSPVAAVLPADLPGRGYLRRAGAPPVGFQTRQVTAPDEQVVRVLPRRPGSEDPRVPGPAAAGGPIPLDELVRLAGDLAAGSALPPAPWLPEPGAVLTEPDRHRLGVIDLPDEQDQRPWTLPSGSLLVAGPPGSGRSTALRRWGSAVIADGGQLAVVDAGGGLRDWSTHPGVPTYLDADDPALVLRLLELLDRDLGTGPPGGTSAPFGLLIDGWDALAATLDGLDYGQWQTRLAEIAGRGPALGIRVAVAGGLRIADHRAAAAFTTRLLLGCPDRGGTPIPGLPPGRGRLEGSVQGEVQVAAATPGGQSTGIGVEQDGRPAARVVVRPLPQTVDPGSLPPSRPEKVVLGRGGDDAGPVGLDLTGTGGGLLIAGPRRSGVSSAVTVLADGAAQAGIPVARLALRPAAELPGVVELDLRPGAEVLRRFLAAHTGPLLLVADDADRLAEHPVADLLVRYLAVAGTGQFLALGCRLDLAARSHRGPIAEAAAFRNGVLIGAGAVEAALLDTALPRRRGPVLAGRGHLVTSGTAVPIQLTDPRAR